MSRVAIANLISSQIGRILEDWYILVSDESQAEYSNSLSGAKLIEHVPSIILHICELLGDTESPSARCSLEDRTTVYLPFQQGYKGLEVIRELSLLRATLLDYLTDISRRDPPTLTREEHCQAARIINRYLDEEMDYALSIFCNASIDSTNTPLPN